MKNKFKVGDKVKNISTELGLYIKPNEIYTVKKISESEGNTYLILKEIEKPHNYSIHKFELVTPKAFTKSDLKERWLVKLRNDKEYVIDKDSEDFLQLERIIYGKVKPYNHEHLDNYYEDLKNKVLEEFDIMEVYKPHYQKVWTREEEDKPIEMTVSEIEEKLGHKVKVIADERED